MMLVVMAASCSRNLDSSVPQLRDEKMREIRA